MACTVHIDAVLWKLQSAFLGLVVHHCFTKLIKYYVAVQTVHRPRRNFESRSNALHGLSKPCSVQLVQARKAALKAGGLQTVMRCSKQDKGPAVQML